VLVLESGQYDRPDEETGAAAHSSYHIDPLDPTIDVETNEPWIMLGDLLLDELREVGARLEELSKAERMAADAEAAKARESAPAFTSSHMHGHDGDKAGGSDDTLAHDAMAFLGGGGGYGAPPHKGWGSVLRHQTIGGPNGDHIPSMRAAFLAYWSAIAVVV